jgi:hypothetical protein
MRYSPENSLLQFYPVCPAFFTPILPGLDRERPSWKAYRLLIAGGVLMDQLNEKTELEGPV